MRIRLGPYSMTRGTILSVRLSGRIVPIKNRLDCKTRKTKQEEQNAMKKIQINRAKGHAKNGQRVKWAGRMGKYVAEEVISEAE